MEAFVLPWRQWLGEEEVVLAAQKCSNCQRCLVGPGTL